MDKNVKNLSFLECIVLFQIVEKELEKVANIPLVDSKLADINLYIALRDRIVQELKFKDNDR